MDSESPSFGRAVVALLGLLRGAGAGLVLAAGTDLALAVDGADLVLAAGSLLSFMVAFIVFHDRRGVPVPFTAVRSYSLVHCLSTTWVTVARATYRPTTTLSHPSSPLIPAQYPKNVATCNNRLRSNHCNVCNNVGGLSL